MPRIPEIDGPAVRIGHSRSGSNQVVVLFLNVAAAKLFNCRYALIQLRGKKLKLTPLSNEDDAMVVGKVYAKKGAGGPRILGASRGLKRKVAEGLGYQKMRWIDGRLEGTLK